MKKIAYQGVKGAFAELACKNSYPQYETVAHNSFAAVFEAVDNESVDLGMIPIENSYAGRVDQIHNILASTKLNIIAEYTLEIKHHLIAKAGTKLEDIKLVRSHPQALMQCSKKLQEMNKANGTTSEGASNTAVAAKEVQESQGKSIAAIGSHIAAKEYGLEILAEEIQDVDDNMTLFIVISKQPYDPEIVDDKKIITTMMYEIRNIPSALYKSLGGFATNNVNLIKLESYIPAGPNRKAQFFISFAGHPSQENVKRAIEELGFYSTRTKLLGVYYADDKRLGGSI